VYRSKAQTLHAVTLSNTILVKQLKADYSEQGLSHIKIRELL